MKNVIMAISMLSLCAPALAKKTDKPAAVKTVKQEIVVDVTDRGFQPSDIHVKPGEPVVLKITRKSDLTCATSIEIPDKKIKADLPLNQTVTVELGPLQKGEIRFGCAMKMMVGGKIFVE